MCVEVVHLLAVLQDTMCSLWDSITVLFPLLQNPVHAQMSEDTMDWVYNGGGATPLPDPAS